MGDFIVSLSVQGDPSFEGNAYRCVASIRIKRGDEIYRYSCKSAFYCSREHATKEALLGLSRFLYSCEDAANLTEAHAYLRWLRDRINDSSNHNRSGET